MTYSRDQSDFYYQNLELGDFLRYKVEIFEINLDMDPIEEVTFKDPNDEHKIIAIPGYLSLNVTGKTQDRLNILAKFRLIASEDHDNYQLLDQISFDLIDNQVYLNDSFWGYCPFFYQQQPTQDRIYTGIKGYSYTYANASTGEFEPNRYNSDTIYGYQPIIYGTAMDYEFKSGYGIMMGVFSYDRNTGIAYSTYTSDPFWSIFPKGFELRGSNTHLIESNIDFGEPDNFAKLIITLLPILLGPGIIFMLGFLIFLSVFITRRIQRRNRRKRRKSRRRRS